MTGILKLLLRQQSLTLGPDPIFATDLSKTRHLQQTIGYDIILYQLQVHFVSQHTRIQYI
jgi:hypothetical protein